MPVYTFFDTYDFSGKTIDVFVTHGGSGFSELSRGRFLLTTFSCHWDGSTDNFPNMSKSDIKKLSCDMYA